MIFGIGCDIVEVRRMEKWVQNPGMYMKFFHKDELASETMHPQRKAEHYAARFAAKEAFSKALGTGLAGFSLGEVCLRKNNEGKPDIFLEGKALGIFRERCGGNARIHVSISHEKEYAVAYVIIEN